jgi:hypothetical protein
MLLVGLVEAQAWDGKVPDRQPCCDQLLAQLGQEGQPNVAVRVLFVMKRAQPRLQQADTRAIEHRQTFQHTIKFTQLTLGESVCTYVRDLTNAPPMGWR